MRTKLLCIWTIALVIGISLAAQTVAAQESGGGQGRGGWMGGSPPIAGTITAVTATDLTIRTQDGDVYKVNFSANTHFMKDRQPVKSSDLKVGDTVLTAGVVDAKARTVAAAFVAELDAEQAKRMRDAQASYGKTWLGGKIVAIDETKLTIDGMNGKPATFIVDESTSFKKRNDSITLADVKVGDRVRVSGEVKNGIFTAAALNVMEPRPDGEHGPREGMGPGMGAPPAAAPPAQK